MAVITKQPTENWYRQLKGDRIEVCLKQGALRMRASGTEAEVWKLVEAFEELSGAEAVGEWRRPARTGARQLAGQLSITEQLESDDGEE